MLAADRQRVGSVISWTLSDARRAVTWWFVVVHSVALLSVPGDDWGHLVVFLLFRGTSGGQRNHGVFPATL